MKINFKNGMNTLKTKVSKNKPTIFTVVGIVGIGVTVYTAVKATPKALEIKAEKEAEKYNEIAKDHTPTPEECKLTVVEQVKATWRLYLPSVVGGIASITCFIGANSISSKRIATMTTAYQLSETAYNRYKEEVVKTIGEEKAKTIQSNVNQQVLNENPASSKEIIFTSSGDTLIYEPLSGRYFKSDPDKIKNAVNQLNHNRLNDRDATIEVNDFFEAVQLGTTDLGAMMGWYLEDGLLDVDFDAKVADDGKTPCLVVEYCKDPEPLLFKR